jgi:hypothetical protein
VRKWSKPRNSEQERFATLGTQQMLRLEHFLTLSHIEIKRINFFYLLYVRVTYLAWFFVASWYTYF